MGLIVIVVAMAAALVLYRLLGVKDAHPGAPLPALDGETLTAYASRMLRLRDEPLEEDWVDCPCCACPGPPRDCLVCGWDADVSGVLEERRARFAETGTVHSADELAGWQGSPPDAEDRALQAEILEICARARAGDLAFEAWWPRYDELRDTLSARAAGRLPL